MELNLAGDAKETLRALHPAAPAQGGSRLARRRSPSNLEEWWELMEARAMQPAKPINPQRVFRELSPRLPDNAILSSDSGSSANWYARDIKIRAGMMASLSGNLATMCPGVPYAIAAKFAYPDRVPVAMVGDGAMQMLGNNGLLTIAHYWKEWADPRLVILVLNNRDLNQVTWEMRVMEGNPKFEASQEICDFPYARYAEMLGLRGIRVDKPEETRRRPGTPPSQADRPVVAGGGDRSRRAAAAAAHHAGAGGQVHLDAVQGRSRRGRHHPPELHRDGRQAPAAPKTAIATSVTGGSRPWPAKTRHAKFRDTSASTVVRRRELARSAPPRGPAGNGRQSIALRDPHRRAGVRRDARVGSNDAGPRRALRPAIRQGSATPTRTEPPPTVREHLWPRRSSGRTALPFRRFTRKCSNESAISAGPGLRRWRSPRSTPRCGTPRRVCWSCRSSGPARRGAGAGAGLRQRRLHLVQRRPPARAAGRLGVGRVAVREDEGGASAPATIRRACGRRAKRSAPTRDLFVDANGAYDRKQALALAGRFAAEGVRWFEEPVSSDDLDGLRLLRDRGPAGMDIAAGEYGYDPFYFRRMLEAGAVDVLQADAIALRRRDRFLLATRSARRTGLRSRRTARPRYTCTLDAR